MEKGERMHKLLPFVWGGGGTHTDIQKMEKENKTHIYFFSNIAFSLYNIEIHASLSVMMETANMRITKGYNLK